MAVWLGRSDFMPLMCRIDSPMLTHKFSDRLGMAQVELVSMVIVNNGLSPVERHELQVI